MNPSYSTFAVADLLDAFTASEPVPGGGAAAALTGALGVSLLLMAAGIPRTRTGAPEETADLAEAAAKLRPLRDTLTALVDRDSAAYASVLAAFRLPRSGDEEKKRRAGAIDAAMREATEAPLDLMRACQQSLRGAVVVAERSSRNASSDVAVAVELLMAAMRGGSLSVTTNLGSLKDEAYVARVEAERAQLEADSTTDAARAREHALATP